MRVVIVGAGLAGLWTALVLGRRGHDVEILERDPLEESPGETRRGTPHAGQPHLFLGAVYRELVREAPDLLHALRYAGARVHDQLGAFPGSLEREADDWQLRVICCRRVVFERVLREAVRREPGVTTRSGTRVLGLTTEPGRPLAVTGVMTDRAPTSADITVLATGRAPRHWLRAHPVPAPRQLSSPSGLTHFSRHYRLTSEARIDLTRWPLGGPHGECAGYSFHIFIGDNDTFSLIQAIRRNDHALRILRDAEAFTAAARSIPVLSPFLDAAVPVTPVLPFGGVPNTFHDFTRDGTPLARNLFVLGDALSHTNSFYGYGASVAFGQGSALSRILDEYRDPLDQAGVYYTEGVRDALARYHEAAGEDLERQRYWNGDAQVLTEEYRGRLYERRLTQSAARFDPAVFRAVLRRTSGLDAVDALRRNADVMARAAALAHRPATARTSTERFSRESILEHGRSAVRGSDRAEAVVGNR